jgi:hypothetical protein
MADVISTEHCGIEFPYFSAKLFAFNAAKLYSFHATNFLSFGSAQCYTYRTT